MKCENTSCQQKATIKLYPHLPDKPTYIHYCQQHAEEAETDNSETVEFLTGGKKKEK